MISFAKRIANVEEYYFSKKLAEVRKLDTPEFPTINLGIEVPTRHRLRQQSKRSQQQRVSLAVTVTRITKGIPALRQAIAAFNERTYGVKLDAETQILPLMGSKEGIMHIMMAFVDEGDEVLIPDPGYPTYASVAKLVGAKTRTYKMTEEQGWKINVKDLRAQDLSKVKIMWVNFPHMPTGTTASKARDETTRRSRPRKTVPYCQR